ncbi:MAG TPA: CBS domain-containing protein [Candidatus Caenarcaniphilales bacterium]
MTPNPITVQASDSVETVLKLLEERHISGLPVVNEQAEVIGIVSEGDLLFKEAPIRMPLYLTFLGGVIYLESFEKFDQQLKKSLGMLVQDVMTPNPVTVSANTSISQAATLMLDKRINRLPVVDQENKLTGIITRTDLIQVLRLDTAATSS